MTQKTIPFREIKRLADDIRLIKDFSENHNFDTSLINASIGPKNDNSKPWDLPLVCASVFTVLVVSTIAALNFWGDLSVSATKFIFVLGLLFAGLASLCVHRRFDNTTMTIIAGLFLSIFLLVGAGIFTPKEAVGELQKFHQK